MNVYYVYVFKIYFDEELFCVELCCFSSLLFIERYRSIVASESMLFLEMGFVYDVLKENIVLLR